MRQFYCKKMCQSYCMKMRQSYCKKCVNPIFCIKKLLSSYCKKKMRQSNLNRKNASFSFIFRKYFHLIVQRKCVNLICVKNMRQSHLIFNRKKASFSFLCRACFHLIVQIKCINLINCIKNMRQSHFITKICQSHLYKDNGSFSFA